MSKATTDALESLHGALAAALEAAIRNPGEGGISASVMNVARQFLKDNHIEIGMEVDSNLSEVERQLANLAGLPFDGEVPQH